jgi:hypothetical protein
MQPTLHRTSPSIEKRGRSRWMPSWCYEETPRRASRKRRERYNTRSTFETFRCNTCNIRLKTDETLETSETLTKTPEKHSKTIVKHIQHPDKTLATYMRNVCNIQINTPATYI